MTSQNVKKFKNNNKKMSDMFTTIIALQQSIQLTPNFTRKRNYNTSLKSQVSKHTGVFFQKTLSWSSHRRCLIKQGVLKNFAVFTRKQLCWNLFLIKLQTWRALAPCFFVSSYLIKGDALEVSVSVNVKYRRCKDILLD